MTALRLVVAVSSLVLTLRAAAWDDFGHMTVAAVAWEQLSPDLRQRATALLKLNPNYQAWIANVPPETADEVAFVKAATWPDAIKRDGAYKNDGEQPTGPDAARNIGYGDLLQHRYWHFVDEPFSRRHAGPRGIHAKRGDADRRLAPGARIAQRSRRAEVV